MPEVRHWIIITALNSVFGIYLNAIILSQPSWRPYAMSNGEWVGGRLCRRLRPPLLKISLTFVILSRKNILPQLRMTQSTRRSVPEVWLQPLTIYSIFSLQFVHSRIYHQRLDTLLIAWQIALSPLLFEIVVGVGAWQQAQTHGRRAWKQVPLAAEGDSRRSQPRLERWVQR